MKTFNLDEYVEVLKERLDKLKESLCAKGKSEQETEYERGKVAEIKQQLSYLNQFIK